MNPIAPTTAATNNSRHVLQKKKSLSQFIWNLHFKKNKIIAKFACHITTHGGYQWGWAERYTVNAVVLLALPT
jgi:hypothetical protein